MMRKDFLVLVVAGLLAGSCRGQGAVSASIAASVKMGPGTRIVMSEHAPFPWDRMCVFGPYTGDAEVEAVTGVPGAATQAYDIRSNDGIDLLMFIDAGKVTRSVAHPRNQGDFGSEVVGRCYARGQAVFSVRKTPPGSPGNIGPA